MFGIRDQDESLNAFGLRVAVLQGGQPDQGSLTRAVSREYAYVMPSEHRGHQSFQYFRRLGKAQARAYVFQLDPQVRHKVSDSRFV
jgi:hypothetical protein